MLGDTDTHLWLQPSPDKYHGITGHVDVKDGQDPLLPAPSMYAESWTSCQKLDLAKIRDFPHGRFPKGGGKLWRK